jgi:hypothetical protein
MRLSRLIALVPRSDCACARGLSAVACWLVVWLLAMPAVAWGAGWVVQPSPLPGGPNNNDLLGVSCVAAGVCIAVGDHSKSVDAYSRASAVRWNGTRWVIQPTPHPPGRHISSLDGVSCTSVSVCTAVGENDSRAGGSTLAERWDGTRWTIQPTLNPPGGRQVGLTAVSCVSAAACTAVGGYKNRAGDFVSLAERWDGGRWAIQATPNPPGGSVTLDAVSCPSANVCTAVGYYANDLPLVERWDRAGWVIQPSPNPSVADQTNLSGVSCTSASACIVVGSNGDMTLAERWDGTRWTIQPTPNPPGGFDQLYGVSCAMASACTAVGVQEPPGDGDAPLAERWNGTRWAVQPTPIPRTEYVDGLLGVSCATTSTCTALSYAFIESWTRPTFAVSRIKTEADGTIRSSVRVPRRGSVDVLATAWKDNFAGEDSAHAAVSLKPAARRFVFARQHQRVTRQGTVTITPNQQGRLLVAHPRYRVVLRLWVSYTPDGGRDHTIGYLGLHLPGTCAKHNSVAAVKWRTVVRCN